MNALSRKWMSLAAAVAVLSLAGAAAQAAAVIQTSVANWLATDQGTTVTLLVSVQSNDTATTPVSVGLRVSYDSDAVVFAGAAEEDLGAPVVGAEEGTAPNVYRDISTLGNVANNTLTPNCFTVTFGVVAGGPVPFSVSLADDPEAIPLAAGDFVSNIPHTFDASATADLGVVVPAVAINEIRIDQPGGDDDEFFELAGAPSASLDGLTYVVIGDGTGGSGVIESVTPLDGAAIPADGLFLLAKDLDTFGEVADTTGTLGFENSDNVTHLLVLNFSGSLGQDLDVEDDGVLDVTPWDAVVDAVGIVETIGTGELLYAATLVGPDGGYVPGQVYRLPDGTGAWNIGGFDPAVSGHKDTPGYSNASAPTGVTDWTNF